MRISVERCAKLRVLVFMNPCMSVNPRILARKSASVDFLVTMAKVAKTGKPPTPLEGESGVRSGEGEGEDYLIGC